jgi:hypothetical protein
MTAESVPALSMPAEHVIASVTSGSVPGECVMFVPMMTAHRVPRKTPTAALSVMPTVMMAAMVTMTGPTARRPLVATARPTVVVMSAMSPMSHECKFRSVPAGKAFAAAPALMRAPSGATKACVTRLPPCECRSVVRAAPAPCAAVCPRAEGSAPTAAATGTPAWSTSTPFGPAPLWLASFASLGSASRLPRDLAIGAVASSAITIQSAAFTAIPPRIARGTLVGRILPFGSASLVAISGIAAVHHAFFVSTVIVPANPALLILLLFTPPVALGTAAVGARVLTNSATTSRRPALVRAGTVSVPIVGRVGHFGCSNLSGGIGAPIPLCDKLHDRCRRNSSKKHQRVIAHRQFPRHPECEPILRIDAVTDLGTSPAPAPLGRFSSAVEA